MGDLKGDPRKFMERWFDIHLYLANWGTRRLMIRVPNGFVNQADIDPFLREIDWVEVWTSGDHLIIDIQHHEVAATTTGMMAPGGSPRSRRCGPMCGRETFGCFICCG